MDLKEFQKIITTFYNLCPAATKIRKAVLKRNEQGPSEKLTNKWWILKMAEGHLISVVLYNTVKIVAGNSKWKILHM